MPQNRNIRHDIVHIPLNIPGLDLLPSIKNLTPDKLDLIKIAVNSLIKPRMRLLK